LRKLLGDGGLGHRRLGYRGLADGAVRLHVGLPVAALRHGRFPYRGFAYGSLADRAVALDVGSLLVCHLVLLLDRRPDTSVRAVPSNKTGRETGIFPRRFRIYKRA
jgi:hypothetical protein